ncbi:hypothetical protein QTI33_03705 [Variovorax sp. J22P271]|uniref:hypothetical protein n=1 Tax=Variovorax davisae TaxID=3053515 RepID=UPI0025761F2C|nr:hypothetical protein [Variovorax sp. J22P271]MDM0031240.1 hypothetical protein [Variovorax sp. J22P271]
MRSSLGHDEKALLAYGRRLGLDLAAELLKAELEQQALHSNPKAASKQSASRSLPPGPAAAGYITKA